ncbi:MAG: hypothetical protein ABI653_00940 [Bacteroidota bacterium]
MQEQDSLNTLRDIKNMMERSSRFISLSGLSGISAGIIALAGAWLAWPFVYGYKNIFISGDQPLFRGGLDDYTLLFNTWLFWIAAGTFILAILFAFIFTFSRSKKQHIPIWGIAARRLMIQMSIPLLVGGLFLVRLLHFGTFGLIAPGCLIFYGLALVNAAKYTLTEIKYLGYCELLLGIISLWFVGFGLYFWAFGFGILHIIYGLYMWRKYETVKNEDAE